MPRLAERLLYAHVRACVSRAVVSGKQQFELLPGRPAATEAEDRAGPADFNERTHPGNEQKVRHAPTPPAIFLADAFPAALSPQGFPRQPNLFLTPHLHT